MMIEDRLHQQLTSAVMHEPPIRCRLEDVTGAGRRRQRRHQLVVTATTAGVVVAAGSAIVGLASVGSGDSSRPITIDAAAPVAKLTPSDQRQLTPMEQRIADAIRSASPAGWSLDLDPDRWDEFPHSGWGVTATADDGNGATTLGVTINMSGMELHPCNDPDVADAASCQEQSRPDGSVLTDETLTQPDGMRSVVVVLTHPDGSGVEVGSGNFTIAPWPPPHITTEAQKKALFQQVRSTPTYDSDQLTNVVNAVNQTVWPDMS